MKKKIVVGLKSQKKVRKKMSRPRLVCKRGVLLTVKKQKYFVTTANVSLNIILNVRLPQSRKPCSNDCPVICDERFKIPKAEDGSAVLFGCV